MRGTAWIVTAAAVAAVLGYAGDRALRSSRQQERADELALERLDQDVRVTDVMRELASRGVSGPLAFVDVGVLDPETGTIAPGRTVFVRNGRFERVEARSAATGLGSFAVIDGAGEVLSPGLVDMHVHTERMAEHLLRLAAGVTSVRDMDGFPWHLRARAAVEAGAMVGATMYVAGTIIADQPLDGYAVVVRTEEAARQAVRDQAACGYSYVKVHNSLAPALFDAVAGEAARLHRDLVGHVPHEISLRHAIQTGHMRTLEHLKGFLLDRTLLPSEEPYAPAFARAEVWVTPTLYARLDGSYGDEARRLLADPRQRLSPRSRRDEWLATLPAAGSMRAKLHDRLVETQEIVMRRLLPLHPRWLVGTDAAGYPFNLAGFATLDELELLRQQGLSSAEVIRAATVEPAVALRREGELGVVAAGRRADAVLLSASPLDDVAAFQSNLGVLARGRWYDARAITSALDAVARIYGEPLALGDARDGDRLARTARERAGAGFVFDDDGLESAASALARRGLASAAETLRALVSQPKAGPCAATRP
jgi:hypothetical protein